MSSATGAAIEPVDRDDAKHPAARGGLAQSIGGGGVLERHRHLPVLDDDRVGTVLDISELARGRLPHLEVDRARSIAEVHARRRRTEEILEDRGKEVLTRVLLHEIEATGPVDHAGDRHAGFDRCGQQVGHLLVFVHHINDRNAVEAAKVVRLPAGRGIKGAAVEVDTAAAVGDRRDGGRK